MESLKKYLDGYIPKEKLVREVDKGTGANKKTAIQYTLPYYRKRRSVITKKREKEFSYGDKLFIWNEMKICKTMKYLDFYGKVYSINIKEGFTVSCTYCNKRFDCEIIKVLEELLKKYQRKSDIFLSWWIALKLQQSKCNKRRYFIFDRYGSCFDPDEFQSYWNKRRDNDEFI